jgi:hypothetical protein
MPFVLVRVADFPVEIAYGFKQTVSVKGLNRFIDGRVN